MNTRMFKEGVTYHKQTARSLHLGDILEIDYGHLSEVVWAMHSLGQVTIGCRDRTEVVFEEDQMVTTARVWL